MLSISANRAMTAALVTMGITSLKSSSPISAKAKNVHNLNAYLKKEKCKSCAF